MFYVVKWFSKCKRKFPWRKPGVSAYQILVTEMLLRKTKSESVAKISPTLFKKYPTPASMAGAKISSIERMLQPLGLSKIRSKAIRSVSSYIVDRNRGVVPRQLDELTRLPHVGRYTANALLCFAYGQRTPIVDSNIARIFKRAFKKRIPVELHKAEGLWRFAYQLLPDKSFKKQS